MWPVISSDDVSPFQTHPGKVLLWYLPSRICWLRPRTIVASGDLPYSIWRNVGLIQDGARNHARNTRHLQCRSGGLGAAESSLASLTRCKNSMASNLQEAA